MPDFSCETCAFFHAQDDSFGQCRGDLPTYIETQAFGQWPVVRKTDWCAGYGVFAEPEKEWD
jgi:hypothetical protein